MEEIQGEGDDKHEQAKAEMIEVKVRTKNSGSDFFYVSKGNTRLGYT